MKPMGGRTWKYWPPASGPVFYRDMILPQEKKYSLREYPFVIPGCFVVHQKKHAATPVQPSFCGLLARPSSQSFPIDQLEQACPKYLLHQCSGAASALRLARKHEARGPVPVTGCLSRCCRPQRAARSRPICLFRSLANFAPCGHGSKSLLFRFARGVWRGAGLVET